MYDEWPQPVWMAVVSASKYEPSYPEYPQPSPVSARLFFPLPKYSQLEAIHYPFHQLLGMAHACTFEEGGLLSTLG